MHTLHSVLFCIIFLKKNNAEKKKSFILPPAWLVALFLFGTAALSAHPMEKIKCGEENRAAFSAALQSEAPAAYALVKALYGAGMIPGLRGIELTLGADHAPATVGEDRLTAVCQDCRHWRRDTIGCGQGIGQCLAGDTRRAHWPHAIACAKFEGKS